MAVEILMPKLGVTMMEGKIISWIKKEGDYINIGDILFVVETDKVSMDVESSESGYMLKILQQEGDTVPVASPIALMGDKDEEIHYSLTPTGGNRPSELFHPDSPDNSIPKAPVNGSETGPIPATPRARKVAGENGIDLKLVKGSGGNGRITEDDVLSYIEARRKTSVVQTGERIPFNGVRRVIADKLYISYHERPHTYFAVDVCMQKCMELRKRLNKNSQNNISISDFLIKAAAKAIEKYPYINSSLDDESIIIHKHINIGFAVDAPKGLIVPVISDAGRKTLGEIAADRRSMVFKAKEGSLQVKEIQGGTFTISNLGTYGIDSFTAIINPPESAIIAVGAIKKMLVVEDDDSIRIKPMMNITLSVDHRVIDGAHAASFISTIRQNLEQPEQMDD